MSCANCSPGEFMAERTDYYRTAHKILKDLYKGDTDVVITTADVMELARYLAGDDV